MKLAKCDSGHFFDSDKYPECPYCNVALQKESGIVAPAKAAAAAPAPTATSSGPVAGWLVVLDGPAMGRDLRLGQGRSFVGQDGAGAPAVLSADAPLSARQAVVVYDPQDGAFTLLPGSSNELCYLAGKAVLTPQPLQGGETLTLAGAALRFVPFCGQFRWAQVKKADKPEKLEKTEKVEKLEKTGRPEKTEKQPDPAEKPANKPADQGGRPAKKPAGR